MKNRLHKLFQKLGIAKSCHKQKLGYRCQHRVYNGMRECDGRPVV